MEDALERIPVRYEHGTRFRDAASFEVGASSLMVPTTHQAGTVGPHISRMVASTRQVGSSNLMVMLLVNVVCNDLRHDRVNSSRV